MPSGRIPKVTRRSTFPAAASQAYFLQRHGSFQHYSSSHTLPPADGNSLPISPLPVNNPKRSSICKRSHTTPYYRTTKETRPPHLHCTQPRQSLCKQREQNNSRKHATEYAQAAPDDSAMASTTSSPLSWSSTLSAQQGKCGRSSQEHRPERDASRR